MENLRGATAENIDLGCADHVKDEDIHTFILRNPTLTIHVHPRADGRGWAVTCEELEMMGISLDRRAFSLRQAKVEAMHVVYEQLMDVGNRLLAVGESNWE